MSAESYSRIAIAYNNRCRQEYLDSITPGGISGFVPGFSSANLGYQDPWTMMKTNGISGTPTIYLDLDGAYYPRVLGILNHNLFSAGYSSLTVAHSPAYLTVATLTFNSTDDDIWIGWSDSVASDIWRIQLNTTANDFQIGSIFLGSRHILDRNPSAASMSQDRETEMTVEQTAGGAKHFTFGAEKRSAALSLGWKRDTMDDVHFWRQLDKDELVGVLTPELRDAAGGPYVGGEVFWGYVKRRQMRPRGPGGINTGQQARYEVNISLEGAV